MLREKEFPVYGDNGFRGTLLSAARFLDSSPEKRVRLEDGREIKVPSSALVAQADGSYYLHTAAQQDREPVAPPSQRARDTIFPSREPDPVGAPPAERMSDASVRQGPDVDPQRPDADTRRSDSEPRRVLAPSASESLFREDCDVERVAVKRMLDKPAEIRQDGDTLIIPLMEEVLVIEKRLMLREELHIRRRREHKPDSDRVPIPLEDLSRS